MLFSIGRPAKDPAEVHDAPFQIVSPGYFRAMRIPLLRGRDFTEQDTPQAPLVTIVNQALVRRFFPNEDPIGKKLFIETLVSGRQELGPPVAWEIIGVVGTVKVHSLGEEESPEIYVPYSQSPWPFTRLVVRTAADPMALANSVKSAIRQIDKDQPVTQFRTMEQIVAASASQPRFWTILLGLFAAIALTLAAVGIYGVISYAVTQRTHEIGVRLALGAQKKDVLNLVVRQSMVPALNGVGIGLAGALAVTRLMSSLLYSVTATDPVTFIVVPLLLTVVALLACYIPARRVTKVDPVAALRYE
jgi:putative ABC transport system permease protein